MTPRVEIVLFNLLLALEALAIAEAAASDRPRWWIVTLLAAFGALSFALGVALVLTGH